MTLYMRQPPKSLVKMLSGKIFVDTNIFIYVLYEVDDKKHSACIDLLKKAREGEVRLWTTEWVVAELIWFLHRRKKVWSEIELIVNKILTTKGLEIRNKKWLLEILVPCKKVTDFFDSVNMSILLSEGVNRGYSYDRGLDRWRSFKRMEP